MVISIVDTAPWPNYPNRNVFSNCRNLLYDNSASFGCNGRHSPGPAPAAANALSLAKGAVCLRHNCRDKYCG